MIAPEPISLTEFLSNKANESQFLAVLGRPIAHSLSPLIHNFALQRSGINATYYPILVSEEEELGMRDLFRHPNFLGANVTIPLKQKVVQFVDQVSEAVSITGAANTIYRLNEGKIAAANTDISGFLSPIIKLKQELVGKSALIFGSGGAALAVNHALKSIGMTEIFVVSRNPNQKKQAGTITIPYQEWPKMASSCKLIVNTTPLGMYPNVDESPVETEFEYILEGKICYDLIYRPTETRFLKQAVRNGTITINGLEMFVGQAAGAYKLFTGQVFPIEVVKTLLKEYFHKVEQETHE